MRNPRVIIAAIIVFLAVAVGALLVISGPDVNEDAFQVPVTSTETTVKPKPTTTVAPTTVPPTTAPPTTVYVAPPTTLAPPPPPPPSPEPVAPVQVQPEGDLESMICATFGDQCSKALSVVYCESRFNSGTVGAAGERGLFQIHPVHIPYLGDRGLSWDAMFDPASNIAYAYDLYSRQGWGPWTCA